VSQKTYSADLVVVGAGLAGIAATLEALDLGLSVILLDRDGPEKAGGLAKQSFGGIFIVGSPEQKRSGIKDSPELAYSDWEAVAEFLPGDDWPRRWAKAYTEQSLENVYHWLRERGVSFFPAVHWVERGLFGAGNSVPRFHMVWGTGQGLVEALWNRVSAHPKRARLQLLFGRKVEAFDGTRCAGEGFVARGGAVVICSGGIAGNHDLVRKHWYKPWGKPPETLLNGAHPSSDGLLHAAAEKAGARVTHLDRLWNYAAGVRHPRPQYENHGLSLVPGKSALWLDSSGKRFGPVPLMGGFDTRHSVEAVCLSEKKYSWQVTNWKIAVKELAVSGAEFNDAIREKRWLGFLKTVALGNEALIRDLTAHCPDFLTARTVPELASKMNDLTATNDVDAAALERELRHYDDMIDRGPKLHNDDQLRRIAQARRYLGDRLRTCNFQKILDPKAAPLIAIRQFILTRKTLGGIQTNLKSQALNGKGDPIPGLFAAGEAAGFGGGGAHGLRSLEGTFLGSCVLTGRAAARGVYGK
jgi:uncharacterized protein